jgi:hypothetical protein
MSGNFLTILRRATKPVELNPPSIIDYYNPLYKHIVDLHPQESIRNIRANNSGFGDPLSTRLLLIFAITEFLLCLTPGPAVLLVILLSYGWMAERGSKLILKGKFSLLTDRIAGGFLVCAGLGLAAARRL